MTRHASALAAVLLAACGGGGSSTGTPPTTVSPQVAGQYGVAVQLLENDCPANPTVQPQPTSVAHAPGAAPFVLTHGGLSLTGSVNRDGTFTTQSLAVQDPQGPATLTAAGRFTATGLDAMITVAVSPAGAPPCRYVVGWTGAKQGSPNVIG